MNLIEKECGQDYPKGPTGMISSWVKVEQISDKTIASFPDWDNIKDALSREIVGLWYPIPVFHKLSAQPIRSWVVPLIVVGASLVARWDATITEDDDLNWYISFDHLLGFYTRLEEIGFRYY